MTLYLKNKFWESVGQVRMTCQLFPSWRIEKDAVLQFTINRWILLMLNLTALCIAFANKKNLSQVYENILLQWPLVTLHSHVVCQSKTFLQPPLCAVNLIGLVGSPQGRRLWQYFLFDISMPPLNYLSGLLFSKAWLMPVSTHNTYIFPILRIKTDIPTHPDTLWKQFPLREIYYMGHWCINQRYYMPFLAVIWKKDSVIFFVDDKIYTGTHKLYSHPNWMPE